MTAGIIITFCSLLLIAYVFDLTSSKTKIPSVILLLLLGWSVKQFTIGFHISLPDFSVILPVLGTIGLIFIVLEGSLELDINLSKKQFIYKSFFGALLPMIASAFLLAFVFYFFGHQPLKSSLINVIPLCVISSAIAIPSVSHLGAVNKEFVIYESSFSDILGVMFFNFFALNKSIEYESFGDFVLQLFIILIISFVATVALSFLLSKIEHHVKFVPIILLVVLIYDVSKTYHLPSLIFILIFGLFLGNLNKLKHLQLIKKFKPEVLQGEVLKFKELTAEGAFLVRSLFFLLFGFLIETADLLNLETLPWAIVVIVVSFSIRYVQLILSKLPIFPLFFVAPRGLITILLFLSISPVNVISLVNNALVVQVIILSALIMMLGIMFTSTKHPHSEINHSV
jgi:potassium/hydrogen antiporter